MVLPVGIEHAHDVTVLRFIPPMRGSMLYPRLRDALLEWRVRCFYRAMTDASHGKRDRFRQITNKNRLCSFLNSSARLLRAA
jgi:hypothetical protein